MRRKLTGTLFYGACLLAISVLLLTLLVLLYDVLRQGCRGSTWTSSRVRRTRDRRAPGSCPPSSDRSRSG